MESFTMKKKTQHKTNKALYSLINVGMFAGTCTCSQKSDGPFLGPVGFHLHPCTEPVKNVVS